MITISAVPGRLRVHSEHLNGRRDLCQHVESRLLARDAVIGVEARHRTGRLLVLYSAERTDAEQLTLEIETIIVEGNRNPTSRAHLNGAPRGPFRNGDASLRMQLVREAAIAGMKGMLPAPWNTLLPIAAQLMRG